REEVAVRIALRVEPGHRVPVPVPGSPDAGARIEYPHRQPTALKGVELVDPGDSGADDHDVIVHVVCVTTGCSAVRSDLRRCHVTRLGRRHDHVPGPAHFPTAGRPDRTYNWPTLIDNHGAHATTDYAIGSRGRHDLPRWFGPSSNSVSVATMADFV